MGGLACPRAAALPWIEGPDEAEPGVWTEPPELRVSVLCEEGITALPAQPPAVPLGPCGESFLHG